VLYIALIMLILLALLGIVGMQVTGLQERMSFNYRSANVAFQNAEAEAREIECFVEATVNRTATTCPEVPIVPICDDSFDASSWAETNAGAATPAEQLNVRAIGQCISGNTSLRMGEELDEDPNPVYQVTVFSTDAPLNSGAVAAVDTIFRP
jgi:type IV pilus assembly protein PilX